MIEIKITRDGETLDELECDDCVVCFSRNEGKSVFVRMTRHGSSEEGIVLFAQARSMWQEFTRMLYETLFLNGYDPLPIFDAMFEETVQMVELGHREKGDGN